MIDLLFYFGTGTVLVRIINNTIQFTTTSSVQAFAPIEGLKLSREGTIREFPELASRSDWKEEAIKRFKKKIEELATEDARAEYIKKDLAKYGYQFVHQLKQGFRPIKSNAR